MIELDLRLRKAERQQHAQVPRQFKRLISQGTFDGTEYVDPQIVRDDASDASQILVANQAG